MITCRPHDCCDHLVPEILTPSWEELSDRRLASILATQRIELMHYRGRPPSRGLQWWMLRSYDPMCHVFKPKTKVASSASL